MSQFKIELVQAINDWQAYRKGDDKKILSDELKKHAEKLPKEYKILPQVCYRRVDLTGRYALQIGERLSLSESISSWTFDVEVAKSFYGGVPPKEYTGVIFEIQPEDMQYKVILNLDAIFRDKDFLEFCEKYNYCISGYEKGIDLFQNREREIVLDVSELNLNQIHAYGGFSSSKEKLAKMYFGHEPNSLEMEHFDKVLMKRKDATIGGGWISGERKNRVVQKHIEFAQYVKSKIK